MKHLIKKEKNILHGTIGWSHNGKDGQYCEAGETVKIKWQPTAGWGLQEAHYTDAGGNVVAIEGGEFVMPDSAVVIGATFKRFVVEDWKNYEGNEISGGIEGNVLQVGSDGKPAANPKVNVTADGDINVDGDININNNMNAKKVVAEDEVRALGRVIIGSKSTPGYIVMFSPDGTGHNIGIKDDGSFVVSEV